MVVSDSDAAHLTGRVAVNILEATQQGAALVWCGRRLGHWDVLDGECRLAPPREYY